MSNEFPPGFYTGSDGVSRYWNGTAWSEAASAPTGPGTTGAVAKGNSRFKFAVLALSVVVVLLLAGLAGLLVKANIDAQNATAAATAALAKAEQNKADQVAVAAQQAEDARVAASAAAKAKADEEAEAQEAFEAQQAIDDQQRSQRAEQVTDIEKSVLKMARKHARTGFVDGPIKSVDCVPVAGGSTDDLSQTTMKFECFAVYKTNSDGTSSGYYYNATINWDEGSYTYGYGRA